MKRATLVVALLCLLLPHAMMAQTRLDLAQCVDLAVKNNLQLRQGQNQVSLAEVNHLQQKFLFLPAVSAGLQIGRSFGTTVDNFTQQIANSPTTGSPNLGATLVLFQGFSRWNNLHATENRLEAAQYTQQDLENDIRLNTALAFFQTLFALDQRELALQRKALLEQQLAKVEAQVQSGAKAQGDLYSVKAQLATEKSAVVQAENSYERSLLDLLQVMNLDPAAGYEIQRFDINMALPDSILQPVEEVLANAKAINPGIRAKAMEALASKYAVQAARSAFYPTLTLSYGMGSFYSSNSRPILRVEPGPNGTFVPVYGEATALGTQLKDNYGQSLSLNLNVPLFSNYSTRRNLVVAQLNQDNADLAITLKELELEKKIRLAHQDCRAAIAQLAAAREQVESATAAYTYAEARNEAGLMDFYSLLEVLNSKSRAESALIQAQYDLLLKSKVLDLYQGIPLEF
jgi:outer membrane protein